MKNKALVTAIIPAYNAERHLKACVESVLGQTWPHIEIIIVNDGSTDRTGEIADEIAGGNVSVIHQENGGGCKARNTGISHSTGKYLQFLDADDMISPEKIEEQVKALEENQNHVAVCSTVHFTDGMNPFDQPRPDESRFLYDTSDTAGFFANLWGADGQMHMVQTSAWLVPRTLVNKAGMWNEDILLDQDGEFFTRTVLESDGIRVTAGYNYYRKYILGNNVAANYRRYRNLGSAIDSARMKTSCLLRRSRDPRARKAVANVFMQLAVDAYPTYPDLFRDAMLMVRAQGVKPVVPVIGGRSVEFVKHTLGWKFARRVSFEARRIMNPKTHLS